MQRYADVEIKVRDEIEKKQDIKVNKLIDELKQVKTILKSPMLYFKYRDKTFSEISSVHSKGHPNLDHDTIGNTRGVGLCFSHYQQRRKSAKTKRKYFKNQSIVRQECFSMTRSNDQVNDTEVMQSPTASSLLSNNRLRMLRPTSAVLPGGYFTKTRYREDLKRDLQLIDQDYELNESINKEIISYTSKNPVENKTISTNLTSIDPNISNIVSFMISKINKIIVPEYC